MTVLMSQQNNKWDQTHPSGRNIFTYELKALGLNPTDLPEVRTIFKRLTSQQIIEKLESILLAGTAANGPISNKQRSVIEGFIERVKEIEQPI